MSVADDLAAIKATQASIDAVKRKMTQILSQYVKQFNQGSPSAVLATTLTAYVQAFDQLTALTGTLATQLAQLQADTVARTMKATTGAAQVAVSDAVPMK